MEDVGKYDEVQVVAFTMGEEEFACDIQVVSEVIKMLKVTPLPQSLEFIEGVINLRGEVIPVIDLRRRFRMEEAERTKESRIIVVEVEGRMVGLIVDSVSEVIRLPEKQIQEAPDQLAKGRSDLISGVGKVDDRLLIILNTAQILTSEEQSALENINKGSH